MRIAVAQFMHETVTFLNNETTRTDFIYDGSPLGGEALLKSGPGSYIGGFVKVAKEFADVDLMGVTSPMWPKTGTGSGWIAADAYEWFVAGILSELRALHPLDGVFLALHGAMAVRGLARPEADLARRVRDVVGPRAVIAATFDPHGNEDQEFAQFADLQFCAKYFPHYDEYLQGTRAARTLVRAIRGEFRAVHALCKVPILTATVCQWTGAPPWSDLVQRALIWEARAPDLYVNLFYGFPWNDAVDAGMTIHAISNDDVQVVTEAVEDLARFAWLNREDLLNAAKVMSVRDAVKWAKARANASITILADHSDRSGSATWLLSEVIQQDLSDTLIASVADRTLATRLDRINARVGGGI